MPHLTTTTSTYVLIKYSKSHPSSQPNAPEWQHFTNPTLQLILDVKKGVELESVRLRVIWSMDSLSHSAADKREVVLEDIDLFHLSCLQPSSMLKQLPQSLPLKAVYRDTVVGIRYLHPPEPSLEPVYRRFQITFLSSSAALEFVDAIRPICPCKTNLASLPAQKLPNLLSATSDSAPMISNNCTGFMTVPRGAIPSPSISTAFSTSPQVPFSSSQNFLASSQPTLYTSSPLNPDNMPSTSYAMTITGANNLTGIRGITDQCVSTQQSETASSQPVPQNSCSTLQTSSPRPLLSESVSHETLVTASQKDDSSVLLSAIRETSAIYDLPQSLLEQLVGQVIREEGFIKLLEKLDTLWQLKSLI